VAGRGMRGVREWPVFRSRQKFDGPFCKVVWLEVCKGPATLCAMAETV